jgi:hypothetical protein
MVPRKADHPTERTAGFLVFSYLCASRSGTPATWAREHEAIERYIAIVRNEELALRELAAQAAASGK